MDIGSRIGLARARAGLSVRELAKAAGVSPTAISKFERGLTYPRQSTLLSIAKALSVGVEFFFRETKVQTKAPAYRKQTKISARAQSPIEAAIVEAVERYLTAGQLFSGEQPIKHSLPRIAIRSVEDAETAANALRQTWHLGSDPIHRVCGQLEDIGVFAVALLGERAESWFPSGERELQAPSPAVIQEYETDEELRAFADVGLEDFHEDD